MEGPRVMTGTVNTAIGSVATTAGQRGWASQSVLQWYVRADHIIKASMSRKAERDAVNWTDLMCILLLDSFKPSNTISRLCTMLSLKLWYRFKLNISERCNLSPQTSLRKKDYVVLSGSSPTSLNSLEHCHLHSSETGRGVGGDSWRGNGEIIELVMCLSGSSKKNSCSLNFYYTVQPAVRSRMTAHQFLVTLKQVLIYLQGLVRMS